MAETDDKAVIQFDPDKAGLQLTTLDDVWRFAQGCVDGGMVPPGTSVQQTAMRIQRGVELGFTPSAALNAVVMIKDKPGLESKTMLALIIARHVDDPRGPIDCGCSRKQDAEGTEGQLAGWCESWRSGWPKARRTEFLWEEAETAGLLKPRGRNNTPSLYLKFPRDMLQWKAVARHARKYYQDILVGVDMVSELEEVAAAEYEVEHPVTSTSEPAPIDGLLAGVVDETTQFTAEGETTRTVVIDPPSDAERQMQEQLNVTHDRMYTPPAEPCCARKPGHDGDCLVVETIVPEILNKADEFPADTEGGFE